jgi:hypothetical protein
MSELLFRQVHLDFHTSEKIKGVATDFDAEMFAETLAQAKVNSVTCFARCHHGWLYYNSKNLASIIHPYLQNHHLLNQQIIASHKRKIKVPIYITVQWDHRLANLHLDWTVREKSGKPRRTRWDSEIYKPGFYTFLCVNSPYYDFLKDNVKDIFESVEQVDGLFFDIVMPIDCSCEFCLKEMREKGIDPFADEARLKFAFEVINRFKRQMTAYVRQFNKECSIFYNAGHISPDYREITDAYTHFELESLPSGQWGYMHFPIVARYARNMGLDCLGMTGKFHTMWGDFHSFKNKVALDYECFRTLAFNSKCSIGDQLHPKGQLCQSTYELIKKVYTSVEDKEPWCKAAVPVTEIAVLTTENMSAKGINGIPDELYGACRMLQELSYQFDVIDEYCDLLKYKLVVLPDFCEVKEPFRNKLLEFLNHGGAIIASYKSAFNANLGKFTLDFGAKYISEPPFSVDFIMLQKNCSNLLNDTEYVMYCGAMKVKRIRGDLLASGVAPYFERTVDHFCSHQHAPSSGNIFTDAIIKNHRIVYFAHPIFKIYHQYAPIWCKLLINRAIEILLPQRLISHNGPSTLITTINSQPKMNRWVIHLLHYVEQKRSVHLEIVEDIIPLHNLELKLNISQQVQSIRLVPECIELPFEREKSLVKIKVPIIEGHRMIELQFLNT